MLGIVSQLDYDDHSRGTGLGPFLGQCSARAVGRSAELLIRQSKFAAFRRSLASWRTGRPIVLDQAGGRITTPIGPTNAGTAIAAPASPPGLHCGGATVAPAQVGCSMRCRLPRYGMRGSDPPARTVTTTDKPLVAPQPNPPEVPTHSCARSTQNLRVKPSRSKYVLCPRRLSRQFVSSGRRSPSFAAIWQTTR